MSLTGKHSFAILRHNMTMPLEARGTSSQEARIIHSPVLDVVRQEIQRQEALIALEGVKTQEMKNFISSGRILQVVQLFVSPHIPMYIKGTDKGRYTEDCADRLRGFIRTLERRVAVEQETVSYVRNLTWPAADRGTVYYGDLVIDEVLAHENKTTKIKIKEARPGSLGEVGEKPGDFERESTTPLVRRILINAYPNPLLALIIPRIRADRHPRLNAPPIDSLTIGVSVNRLSGVQQRGVKSRTAMLALSLGVVTQQELEHIFGKDA